MLEGVGYTEFESELDSVLGLGLLVLEVELFSVEPVSMSTSRPGSKV